MQPPRQTTPHGQPPPAGGRRGQPRSAEVSRRPPEVAEVSRGQPRSAAARRRSQGGAPLAVTGPATQAGCAGTHYEMLIPTSCISSAVRCSQRYSTFI